MSESVFPQTKDSDGMYCRQEGGLTKRELFAAMAMQAYVRTPIRAAEPEDMAKTQGEYWAENAVYCADALLAALKKGDEG